MKQADLGLNLSTRRTRKREFLDEMNLVVPWAELVALIAPHAPARRRQGRTPAVCAWRPCCASTSCSSGSACPTRPWKKRCTTLPLYREFAGLDAGDQRLPDESTILRFRHLLEDNSLALQILATVNATLAAQGLAAQERHGGGRHPDCRARVRPRTATASATPRCTRPRRATSGTSA